MPGLARLEARLMAEKMIKSPASLLFDPSNLMIRQALLIPLWVAGAAAAQDGLRQIRAGIVGLDTSHVPAFTKLFNKG